MGPLPIATNGPKFPTHSPHHPIPTLQHQNLPSCHSLADIMKLQDPTHCSILHFKTDWLNFRFANQMIREILDTSAICTNDVQLIKTSLMISDYDIYFWHLWKFMYWLARSYYTIFDLILYYSDLIIFFGSDSYISLYLCDINHTCALSRIAMLSYLTRNKTSNTQKKKNKIK